LEAIIVANTKHKRLDVIRQVELIGYADLPTLGIGFHPVHIRRMILRGEFPTGIRVGMGPNGRVAFRVRDIVEWVARREEITRPGNKSPG
jgi:predicted DNA-binding transcriptional regulator AlpA